MTFASLRHDLQTNGNQDQRPKYIPDIVEYKTQTLQKKQDAENYKNYTKQHFINRFLIYRWPLGYYSKNRLNANFYYSPFDMAQGE